MESKIEDVGFRYNVDANFAAKQMLHPVFHHVYTPVNDGEPLYIGCDALIGLRCVKIDRAGREGAECRIRIDGTTLLTCRDDME